jgi:hypothetical protein
MPTHVSDREELSMTEQQLVHDCQEAVLALIKKYPLQEQPPTGVKLPGQSGIMAIEDNVKSAIDGLIRLVVKAIAPK